MKWAGNEVWCLFVLLGKSCGLGKLIIMDFTWYLYSHCKLEFAASKSHRTLALRLDTFSDSAGCADSTDVRNTGAPAFISLARADIKLRSEYWGT